jgi:two-component system, NtrC family, sensor histidine kinase KinB
LQVNRAAEDLLKAAVSQALESLDPVVRAVIDKARLHVMSGRGPYLPRGLDEAVRVATYDGDRWFLPRASPVYAEEGDVAGTTIVLQEVTRLVRFEELRNNLVATVGHEFRTPLTSLRMAIHLLTEKIVGPLTEKQEDLVHAARSDCERLQTIVDELLDLSRIQSGKIELRLRAVETAALVKIALDAQRGAASQKRIALRSEISPESRSVRVDPERIQLVFSNLLSNAIRYGPEGTVVTVSATAAADGDTRFTIADAGPGIAREYHQAVFDKYFQLPGSSPSGAGLGLFIAREVVQAHGGTIGVASEEGSGSRFWFTVPGAHGKPALGP